MIVILLIFNSCKKRQPLETEPEIPKIESENTLNKNAIFLGVKSVKSVAENTITIDKSNVAKIPEVGSIILSGSLDGIVESFLRKVVSIEDKSGEFICHTEPAALNEAFETINVKAKYEQSFTQILTPGIKSAGIGKLSVSNKPGIISDVNFVIPFIKDTKLFPGLEISGNIAVNITDINFEYIKSKNSPLPDKVLIQVNINTKGSSLEITNSNETAVTLMDEVDLITPITLKPFIINLPIPSPLGIIIFPVPMKHSLSFKRGKWTISGKAKLNVAIEASATVGAKYESGSWKNISVFQINTTTLPLNPAFFLPHMELNANFELFKPVYEMSPFGTDKLKASFSLPNSLDFKTSLMETPNYSLKYNFGISGAVETKFWTSEELAFGVNANLIEPMILLQGNWVIKIDKSEIYSGNNQVGAANTKLAQPLKIIVKDDLGRPLPDIPVEWKVTKGNGTLIFDAKTNKSGQAEAYWTIGTTDVQEVEAVVKDKEGNLVKGAPLKFTCQKSCDLAGTYLVEVYNKCYPRSDGSPAPAGSHTLTLKGGQWTTVDAKGVVFTGSYSLASTCGFSYHNGVCNTTIYPNNPSQLYDCNGCLLFKYTKQ
ncbi:Ig-like domain-containing protein [Pedobacter aquatilis]|uniref:Ig-like domain-containing protein n=1 Tax=Pedobacter aquatilis TaxID=351343 RepID=UPI0025B305BC|nr:Ig-like domain-containing protein [Pedobacter aquatilis]MDN3588208.1 Ig-like domain-containing protein [Pedobacter aquatilis]